MIKQESVAGDGNDSGSDSIRAVHPAFTADATAEVQHSCRTHAGCVTCLTRQ